MQLPGEIRDLLKNSFEIVRVSDVGLNEKALCGKGAGIFSAVDTNYAPALTGKMLYSGLANAACRASDEKNTLILSS